MDSYPPQGIPKFSEEFYSSHQCMKTRSRETTIKKEEDEAFQDVE